MQIILINTDFKHWAVWLSSDELGRATEHRPNLRTRRQTRSSDISRISYISRTILMYRFINIVSPTLLSEVACKVKLTSTPLYVFVTWRVGMTLSSKFLFSLSFFPLFPVFYPNLLSSQYYLFSNRSLFYRLPSIFTLLYASVCFSLRFCTLR
jgi:hypothetical protein